MPESLVNAADQSTYMWGPTVLSSNRGQDPTPSCYRSRTVSGRPYHRSRTGIVILNSKAPDYRSPAGALRSSLLSTGNRPFVVPPPALRQSSMICSTEQFARHAQARQCHHRIDFPRQDAASRLCESNTACLPALEPLAVLAVFGLGFQLTPSLQHLEGGRPHHP